MDEAGRTLRVQESGTDDHTLFKVSLHQIRRLSMSLASKGNIPLESILRAEMWTNPTTFLEFYLKDASEALAQSARFRLGPIAAAQSVVGH